MECFRNRLDYFRFSNFGRYSAVVNHLVTTRNADGTSRFTVSLNGYQPDKRVSENRKLIAECLKVDVANMVFAEQVHGNRVTLISYDVLSAGHFTDLGEIPETDALVTNQPGICLVAKAADCVPILYFDPVKRAIGVAHAGWKGTVKKIAASVVKAMHRYFGSNASDLLVSIGPSIGPCCYEVGNEVVEMVNEAFCSKHFTEIIRHTSGERAVFNLWRTNELLLIESGVAPSNIERAEICTRCTNSRFFSARMGDRGRFGGFIVLRNG